MIDRHVVEVYMLSGGACICRVLQQFVVYQGEFKTMRS